MISTPYAHRTGRIDFHSLGLIVVRPFHHLPFTRIIHEAEPAIHHGMNSAATDGRLSLRDRGQTPRTPSPKSAFRELSGFREGRRLAAGVGLLLAISLIFVPTFTNAANNSRPATAGTISITDDLGRRLEVAHGARRIISLSPSATEVFFAVGAQRRLVADTTRCNYPPAAKQLPRLDGLNPSHEMLIALHPDLIVLSDQTMTVDRADQLTRQYGSPVYVMAASTYDQVEADILRIGDSFGSPPLAAQIVAGMRKVAISTTSRVANLPRPRVFVVIWERPLMTAGGGSFFDNLIGLAGGINVAHREAKYPDYAEERLVADNPDVILTQTEGGSEQLAVLRPLRLRAMHTGRIYTIPDDWTDRPGPRLALGLQAIARDLHPEAFAK